MVKNCVVCGKEFETRRAKYCCAECKREGLYLSGILKFRPAEATCQNCGDAYIKSLPQTKFCSKKCYSQARRKRNLPRFKEKDRVYRLSNKYKELRAIRRANNKGKHREELCLERTFGTKKVSLQIKKQMALIRIGRRIAGITNSIKIDREEINQKIEQIEKGKTYVAYE